MEIESKVILSSHHKWPQQPSKKKIIQSTSNKHRIQDDKIPKLSCMYMVKIKCAQ